MEVVLGWLLKIIPIFEWVRVNGSKYWPHIVMVLVGWYYFALNAEYKELISYSSETISALELQVEDYEGCRTESPDGDPPLRITFTDNRVVFANFFQVVLPLSPPVLPLSPEQRGNRLLIYEQFSNATKAAVYLELESVTFDYARTHREEIEQAVVRRVEPIFASLEVKMEQFNLLGFCEVRSPVASP